MHTIFPQLVGYAALLGCATQAIACSSPGSHTNDELIREAESIVLAKVIAGTPDEVWGSSPWPESRVTLEVVRTLKGAPPRRRFDVAGSLKYFGPNQQTAPYLYARPGAQRGTCFAYDYKLGGTFLLFLKNGNPYWSAVRPTNEEVQGSADKWLAWVEWRVKQVPKAPVAGTTKPSLPPNQSPEPTRVGKPLLAAQLQR